MFKVTNFNQDIEDYCEIQYKKLLAFREIRNLLSNIVESIILLDRKLYIQEQHSQSSVILANPFNSIDSPRNIAIIAYKS